MSRKLSTLSTTKRPSCWGAGFVAMDIVDMGGDRFASVGGSCGNVMAILAWLGWKARPIARLGSDATGSFIREELRGIDVDIKYLTEEAEIRSPVVLQRFAMARDGRRTHRFSLTCPSCGRWLPRYRPITFPQSESLICCDEKPNVFYFDRVSPAALGLAERARSEGALVVFEPSSIGDESKFQRAVDSCDVLKYSEQRLGYVPDLTLAASPKLIVETQGESGLRYRWADQWSHVEAFAVEEVVDAAGSGDWCSAILIHELGRSGARSFLNSTRRKIAKALELGQATAAVNCGFLSARGAMQALTVIELNEKLLTLRHRYSGTNHSAICNGPELSGPFLHYCEQCDSQVRGGVWTVAASA